MEIVKTAEVDYESYSDEETHWIYNSLDCCLTSEIFDEISKGEIEPHICSYNFIRAMQAPAMHMALQGIAIDTNKRSELISSLTTEKLRLEKILDDISLAVHGQTLNALSSEQLKTFLYEVLKVPEQFEWDGKTKSRKLSVSQACLEKIIKGGYLYALPVAKLVLKIRNLNKKSGVLHTGIDSDNRMRTSYNVAGTETGRWSSNKNVFNTGTNLQNITDELREIFIADKGMKLAYVDGEQAESRMVAYLSGDEAYIDACEGGDLHTQVTKMVWSELPWTGDLAEDKKIAAQLAYGHFSYRDLAKRLGHGTNYLGKPLTMAKHIHVETKLVEEFQERYFSAFPKIPQWHQSVAFELQTTGKLTTPLGRIRYFQGRLNSDDTLKEAIAFLPQSTIAEIINLGMYRVWEKHVLAGEVQLLAQIHDAILIQYPDRGADYQRDIIEQVCQTMTVPVEVNGREMVIPMACEGVGWNWRKHGKGNNNPDSIMEMSDDEKLNRTRQRTYEEATSFLARKLS